MSEEEKKQKHREYSKKYYEKHKEQRRQQMREYNKQHKLEHNKRQRKYYANLIEKGIKPKTKVMKLQEIIDMALNYVEDKGRLKYKPNDLKKILKGEMNYGNKTNDLSKR